MTINVLGRMDQDIQDDAQKIMRIANRLSSPTRMLGRTVESQMDEIIRLAERVVRDATTIKNANPGK